MPRSSRRASLATSPHFNSYENGLQSIWQALLQVATLVEERLEQAGAEVFAANERLQAKMEEVDGTSDKWARAAEKQGAWRFVRPDYGWLWWRTRYFALPRQLSEFSDALAAYNDARLVEANLHVMRQLCLAQMQDVRTQLYRAEELVGWFAKFWTFLQSCQDEIEGSLGEPWTRDTLEQLWQSAQDGKQQMELGEKFEAFVKDKPLTEWLGRNPIEVYADVAAEVEPWPTALNETNVLALLVMAHAGGSNEEAVAWINRLMDQGGPLWPREHYATDGICQQLLLTPSVRGSADSTDDRANEAGTEACCEKAGDETENGSAAWSSYAHSVVDEWCTGEPTVERYESRLDGLLVVQQAATDLEGLWL